jgi:hypothetical protein
LPNKEISLRVNISLTTRGIRVYDSLYCSRDHTEYAYLPFFAQIYSTFSWMTNKAIKAWPLYISLTVRDRAILMKFSDPWVYVDMLYPGFLMLNTCINILPNKVINILWPCISLTVRDTAIWAKILTSPYVKSYYILWNLAMELVDKIRRSRSFKFHQLPVSPKPLEIERFRWKFVTPWCMYTSYCLISWG